MFFIIFPLFTFISFLWNWKFKNRDVIVHMSISAVTWRHFYFLFLAIYPKKNINGSSSEGKDECCSTTSHIDRADVVTFVSCCLDTSIPSPRWFGHSYISNCDLHISLISYAFKATRRSGLWHVIHIYWISYKGYTGVIAHLLFTVIQHICILYIDFPL